ncbi:MAG: Fis family transcriptional regulator [Sulfurimonas sp.]|uniref:Fis family transcriptional regulator n=1 Tax=Sulfurimonas sp. TaxID=2022749 RepID=UPI00262E196F|nr:Fis family transcriptional regulator [Sulfurimonas sp.]MCW8894238.1 Fis family transcriptional regulator [Sulfurimonas sp.]MCW8954021.1 Fis family transcriptional regulator [Sulfurimonas sp.]MCW9067300.1 Fis family transcriptional regulator [Sulfurimonas sp.]
MERTKLLAVDANYVTASASSAEAFKTATLLKTLSVNSLITGETGVGKKSLASYILPDAPILDASNHDELLSTLESSKEIVITNLENSPNIKKVLDIITLKNIRIIATAKSSYYHENIDDIFSVKFDIPPLSQRPEDIDELVQKFIKEASRIFTTNQEFNMKNFKPDLSNNSTSLRRQVMISYLLQDIDDNELMDIMQNYLIDKLGSNSDYKNFLYLYEVPLIKSGLQRFKSQLQLADKLGLNRNTLRKKIADNSAYL